LTARRLLILLLLPGLAGCVTVRESTSSPDRAGESGRLVERSIDRQFARDVMGRYLISLPADYDRARAWPLLLFLHGTGERGADLNKLALLGPTRLIRDATLELPFIVVLAQVPDDRIGSIQFLDSLIEEITRTHSVDEDRVYVTGVSLGGYGTWRLAFEFPQRFAAIAPISGGGTITAACTIRHLPVWAFHGALDEIVPLSRTEELVERLRDCDGHIRYTRYEDARHDAWTRTYANPELYEWLLLHRRGQPGPR
jgi:predicted peptidase